MKKNTPAPPVVGKPKTAEANERFMRHYYGASGYVNVKPEVSPMTGKRSTNPLDSLREAAREARAFEKRITKEVTSPRVARIAGRILKRLARYKDCQDIDVIVENLCTVGELRALAANRKAKS